MKKIMTHIVAGYPTLKESEKLAMAMAEAGADFIEIQIPFSDPVADGATIMRANHVALDNGVTPEDCFKLMKDLKKQIATPLLFMTYYNIIYRYGPERFCRRVKEAGGSGLIVPDMPIDEEGHEHYLLLCKKYGLNAIQVISPITPLRRLKKISKVASGFIYCVSRTGTTGERAQLDPGLKKYLQKVKREIKLPLAVGFGISSRAHTKAVFLEAEIAVIGSKIINLYDKAGKGKGIGEVKKFISSLK